MSASALLPIAGVAAATLAREAISAVGSGLSFAAELMRQGRGEEADAAAEASPLAAARASLAEGLTAFARRLRQQLAAAGLAVSSPIELYADGLGGVEVGGEHPLSKAIEAIVAADESLRQQFTALGGANERLNGQDKHEFGLSIDGARTDVIPKP